MTRLSTAAVHAKALLSTLPYSRQRPGDDEVRRAALDLVPRLIAEIRRACNERNGGCKCIANGRRCWFGRVEAIAIGTLFFVAERESAPGLIEESSEISRPTRSRRTARATRRAAGARRRPSRRSRTC